MTASDGALADGTSGSAEPTNGGSAAAATVEVERAAPKINDGVSSQGPFHRADLEEPFLIRNTETIVCYRRVESTSRQNIATQLQIFPEVSLCEKHLEPRGKRALRNIAALSGEQQQLWSLITCCEPSLLKVAVQLPLPLATLAVPVRSASRGHYLSIDVSSIFAPKTLLGEPSLPLWVCAKPKQGPSKMSPPKPTVQTLLASAPLQDCARCLTAGVPARESAYAGQSMEARSTAPLRRYCFANIAVLLCAQAGR